MEQYEDIKSELQQELHDLQQNVEQHSSFNKDVWRRAVKRYIRHLYLQNLFSAIFLVIIITASNIVLILEDWPWWLLLPIDLFTCALVVKSLFATNNFRKANVQSCEGLLSLRESMRESTTFSIRKHIIIQIIALIILVAIFFYLFFDDRALFVSSLIGCIVGSIAAQRTVKRVKKRYDELDEEIEELLKEE